MPPPMTATSQDASFANGAKVCIKPFFTAQNG